VDTKKIQNCHVKYWEVIADNLSKAGWSWGCVSAVDSEGRPIWIVDAHRDNGKRFVAHSEEKLSVPWNLKESRTNHHAVEMERDSDARAQGRLSKIGEKLQLYLRLTSPHSSVFVLFQYNPGSPAQFPSASSPKLSVTVLSVL
jgi:hypothetical protein